MVGSRRMKTAVNNDQFRRARRRNEIVELACILKRFKRRTILSSPLSTFVRRNPVCLLLAFTLYSGYRRLLPSSIS